MEEPSQESQIRRIFSAARGFVDTAAQRQYLDDVCSKNLSLRRMVDALLNADAAAGQNPLQQAMEQLEPRTQCMHPQEVAEQMQKDSRAGSSDSESSATSLEFPAIPGYRVIDVLGKGGMGTVYLAGQSEPFAREVAIKVVNPGMDSQQVLKRFCLEQQALALMEHPNIATIFDAGQTQLGHPYFAMELVRGIAIDAYCIQHRLPLPDRLRLFADVCSAVHHAHERGILHRDLKPSNVMVKQLGTGATVKVIDFGVAKSLTEDTLDRTQFTHLAHWVGTPLYMSPEQVSIDSKLVDARSDVYCLGALLYALVSGEPPFTRDDLSGAGIDAIREMICEQEPRRPSLRFSRLKSHEPTAPFVSSTIDPHKWQQDLSGDLDWIILKALEKEPDRRYGTAQQLADDIGRYLGHDPVVAAPPSSTYRLHKLAKRKRSALLATGALVAMLAIAIYWVNSFWEYGQRADRLAQLKSQEAEDLRTSTDQIASEARKQERKAYDFQEASGIRQLLSALGNNDFAGMRELPLPREEDGAFLRTAGVTDPNGGRSLRQILTKLSNPLPERVFEHPQAVNDAVVSPDQKLLATACRDGWLRLWKLDSDEPPHLFGPNDEAAESLAFSPDSGRIACGYKSGQVLAWEIDSKQSFGNFETTELGGIQTLAWSPDGQWLAVGVRYDHVDVLRSDTLATHLRIKPVGLETPPRYESLVFSPDSRQLYVSTREAGSGIQVWDVGNRSSDKTVSTASLDYPRSFCLAGGNQQWLVVGDRPQTTLLIMDTQSGRQLASANTSFAHAQHLAYSIDDERLAAAYLGGVVVVWKLTEDANGLPNLQREFTFAAHDATAGKATKVQLLGQGMLLTAGEDGRACLWRLDAIQATRHDTSTRATIAMQSVDSTQYVALEERSGRQGLVVTHYSDRHSQRELLEIPRLPIPMEHVNSMSFPFLKLSNRIMAVCDDEHVHVWRLREDAHWEMAQVIQLSEPLLAISLDNDGQKLAVMGPQKIQIFASNDRWETFSQWSEWDEGHAVEAVFVEGGRKLLLWYRTGGGSDRDRHVVEERDSLTGKLLQQWTGEPLSFAVSENEKLLALAGESGLRVVDRSSGQTVLSAMGITNPSAKTFCDGDRILLVWHADSSIRAWHLPTGEALGVVLKPQRRWGYIEEVVFGPAGENFVQFWLQAGKATTCVTLGQ